MELIEKLEKQQAEMLLLIDFRIIDPLPVGNYKLSIQGSGRHYCQPKRMLPVREYKTMELTIMNKKGHNINIKRSKVLRNFRRYDELVKCADGTFHIYYNDVPVELLNELYCYLKNI